MDNDKDQKISFNNIDIGNLERPILDALFRFFEWLETEKKEVDFEGFNKALLQLKYSNRVE